MASTVFLLDSVYLDTKQNFEVGKLLPFTIIFSLQHLRDFDVRVFHFSIAVIVSTSNLFVYCFFGKLTTDSYFKMAQTLYDSNWMRSSIEVQKYMVLMIANMQKPLHYHGFSVVVLNLETFSGVCKTLKHD